MPPKHKNKVVFVGGYFLILSVMIPFSSCSDPITPPLSKDMKARVDSLFQDQVGRLDSIADLKCDKDYPAMFKKAQDSIYNLRVEEIRSIIEQ